MSDAVVTFPFEGCKVNILYIPVAKSTYCIFRLQNHHRTVYAGCKTNIILYIPVAQPTLHCAIRLHNHHTVHCAFRLHNRHTVHSVCMMCGISFPRINNDARSNSHQVHLHESYCTFRLRKQHYTVHSGCTTNIILYIPVAQATSFCTFLLHNQYYTVHSSCTTNIIYSGESLLAAAILRRRCSPGFELGIVYDL